MKFTALGALAVLATGASARTFTVRMVVDLCRSLIEDYLPNDRCTTPARSPFGPPSSPISMLGVLFPTTQMGASLVYIPTPLSAECLRSPDGQLLRSRRRYSPFQTTGGQEGFG